MSIKEVAEFADRFATHNERIIITFNDRTVLRGHFINNNKLVKKVDNDWNFVILREDDEKNTKLVISGDDILSIKKILVF
jgi:hypothetical protein